MMAANLPFRIHASALVLVAVLAIPAAATTMHSFDLAGLTGASSDIVVGRVEDVRSRWDSAHRNIVTEVRVAVTQRLKGAGGDRMTLVQLGGQVGDMRVEVDGCPTFRAGEEGVYFVCRDRAGHAMLTGLAQGKFEIARDAKTHATLVQRAEPGFAMRDARTLRPVPAGHAPPRIGLNEFLDEVRVALRAGGAR